MRYFKPLFLPFWHLSVSTFIDLLSELSQLFRSVAYSGCLFRAMRPKWYQSWGWWATQDHRRRRLGLQPLSAGSGLRPNCGMCCSLLLRSYSSQLSYGSFCFVFCLRLFWNIQSLQRCCYAHLGSGRDSLSYFYVFRWSHFAHLEKISKWNCAIYSAPQT